MALLLFLRGVGMALRRSGKADTHEAPLFDRILDSHGLSPIQDEREDELERGRLLDELFTLIAEPRQSSLNFGLEGAWGSGKTSLLNLLRARLEAESLNVVTFNLWSYRKPERLVRVYFDRLAAAVACEVPHLGTRSLVRRIGAGLAELGGGRFAKASQAIFGDYATESLEMARDNLKESLGTLRKPLIVFLDDLDRLDRDELVAVLRSVRLVSDLPKLTQILAYDREQLAKTLFPDDPTGTRARDHIGKIVNYELSIGSLPRELATHLLGRSLDVFLESLDDQAVEHFQGRIQEHGLRPFVEALPTPREIRRVAAATAARWERMADHLNAFDLFVLVILQYRFPAVYSTIRSHPELFVELSWSSDTRDRMGLETEELKRRRNSCIEEFDRKLGGEGPVAVSMLHVLFPNTEGAGALRYLWMPIEKEARRRRRILHPAIVDRYFHLYVPSYVVSEAEIEAYADRLRAEPSGSERQALVVEIVAKEAESERLDSFLDQWDLAFKQHPNSERHDPSLVEDLALGLAQSARRFSDEAMFFVGSQSDRAAFEVLFLSYHLVGSDSSTRLLVEVIRRATRVSFAGTIVLYSSADRRSQGYADVPEPDKDELEKELATKVVGLYGDDPAELLRLSRSDLTEVIFRTGSDSAVRKLLLKALGQEPALLPRVLELGASLRLTGTEAVLRAESLNPEGLAPAMDLQAIHKLTADLPLDSWSENTDRVLVELFRAWVDNPPGEP